MIRWGILGAGNIAGRFAESLRNEPDSELVAVSVRSAEKGRAFVREHPAKRVHIGHEKLLADEEVDVIYLALPHGLHREWAVRALSAKKAVLCEKPAALSADEVREIAEAAEESGAFFMEAMKTRFVPAYRKLRAEIESGVIGGIRSVETSLCNVFSFDAAHPTYHTQKGQGGALLDEGIYCANWLEEFLSGDWSVSRIERTEHGGVDTYTDAVLDFAGRTGRLECAFDREKPRQAVLVGEKGKIIVEDLHRPVSYTVFLDGAEPRRETFPYEYDDFYGEIHHVVECLQGGKTQSDIMPLAASVRCAELLDSIRESGEMNNENGVDGDRR